MEDFDKRSSSTLQKCSLLGSESLPTEGTKEKKEGTTVDVRTR